MPPEPERRKILCPRCDAPLEVPRSAKSALCSACHRNISTQDIDINEYCARVEMYTAGCLTIGKKGTLIAEVRAERIVVKGEIKGPVRARDGVVVEKTGRIFGDLTCGTLEVAAGAKLVGMIVTGPRVAELMAELDAVPVKVA